MEGGERLGGGGVPAKAECIGGKCGNWLRRLGYFLKVQVGKAWGNDCHT